MYVEKSQKQHSFDTRNLSFADRDDDMVNRGHFERLMRFEPFFLVDIATLIFFF